MAKIIKEIQRLLFGRYCRVCDRKQRTQKVDVSSKYNEKNYSIKITTSLVCRECQNAISTYEHQLDCGQGW